MSQDNIFVGNGEPHPSPDEYRQAPQPPLFDNPSDLGGFEDLNWGVLESEDIDSIEELYNDVQLSLNHGYQKNAGMVGTGYMLAMTGLEKASELTNGVVMLNGLSMATAKNEEIRDISSLRLI